jgi:AmiR/NasT family two-component response regulator
LFMTGVHLSNRDLNPPYDPLRQSVTSLALFAMHAAGAVGFSISELSPVSGAPSVRFSHGLLMPQWVNLKPGLNRGDGLAIASYPLHTEGVLAGLLAFVFRGAEVSEEKLSILNRLAAIIETIQALPQITASLASRLGNLDAELAGIKIAERARGILAAGMLEPEAIDTLVAHVERVLEGRRFGSALEQLLPDLEDQVAKRRIVVRAKTLLESRHGISEEQAYLMLRVKSRSSRRRLSEVAQELLAAEARARTEERNDVRQ